MAVYVAEIRGRGIVAFNANKAAEAEDLVRDPAILDDLMVLETGGLPIWDGVTEICVRQALPAEEAKWQASRAKAIRNGNVDVRNPTHCGQGFRRKPDSVPMIADSC
jgi:hypothetical protein